MSSQNHPTALELELLAHWRELLKNSRLGIHDDFRINGGTPQIGSELIDRLEKRFNTIFHIPWLLAAPTVAEQARWIQDKILTPEPETLDMLETASFRKGWNDAFKREPPVEISPKNAQAAFLLSPGRCGSTLLRIMLAGHPKLFVPPETDLLMFRDIRERDKGLHGGWFDFLGLERAIMELWGCDAESAAARVAQFCEQDLTVPAVFKVLQDKMAGRLLVDKSPSYAASLNILKRAEAWFERPLYIHLVRHPLAVIRSWKSANFEQMLHSPPRETAEAAWLFSMENILELLREVPAERQIRVKFEDLVCNPEPEARRICAFLGIDYSASLLDPYDGKRMADSASGHYAGDKVFFRRKSIEASAAASSARRAGDGPLAPDTIAMAKSFGYQAF